MLFSNAAGMLFSLSALQDEAFCKALNVMVCSVFLQCVSALLCRFGDLCRVLQSLPVVFWNAPALIFSRALHSNFATVLSSYFEVLPPDFHAMAV